MMILLGVVGGTLAAAFVSAQTVIPGGDVSGTWYATGSPYLIEGEITVPGGDSLIIEPGVDVIFQGHYKFIVDNAATLLAVGTEQDSILFTAANPGTGWNGIRFTYASGECRLEYCHLIYGKATAVSTEDGKGGGIYCYYSSPQIQHCLIDNCSAYYWGGGGIYCYQSNPLINNNIIRGNAVTGYGGFGGGILCKFNSNPIITNNIISENTANRGGGIGCSESNPTISSNIIKENIVNQLGGTFGEGGGIGCSQSSPVILNNIIFFNEAARLGGGIWGQSGFNSMVKGNTIIFNSAGYLGGGFACELSSPAIVDCILWGNNPFEIYSYFSPNFQVTFSDIQGGWPGTGNINDDPLFVSGPDGDYYLSQIAAGQGQQSPCVDAGDPASPMIIGTTRTDGVQDEGIVDMGYHYPAFAPPPPLTITLTPLNPPIVIPDSGGSFDFIAEIVNGTDSTVIFDVWIDATLPGGSSYGPIFMRRDLSLAALDTLSRQMTQSVGPGAPAGEYSYNASLGIYPNDIWSQDSFPFTKEGEIGGLAGMSSADWKISSWDDEITPDRIFHPSSFILHPAHSNPFNPTTTIRFDLPVASWVRLEVFDITGRSVGAQRAVPLPLVDGWREAGTHEVTFDGSGLASGIYFACIRVGGYSRTMKMILMK